MREILFRGKSLDNGKWIEGDLLRINGHVFIFPDPAPKGIDKYKVDPATVGQYTGRKDKNGKKVYEADILTDKFGSMGVVEWRDSGFVVNFGDTDIFDLSDCFGDSYQMWVVGNIHDNADLIEANTRLIAAAPEMLAALQEIVRQHGLDADNTLLPPIPNRWMDAISKAEKAINKALGR
jgi:hypothetical protein